VIKKNNLRSPIPKIRLEKRAGKYVTVIAGLHTYGSSRLNVIARRLKSILGAGGTVKNGTIEIQGDKVEPIKKWFIKIKDTNGED
jgi:translation initiation factor 1